MNWLRRHGHWLPTLFVAIVFIQSLFFKFTGSPETVYIFQGKLDPWEMYTVSGEPVNLKNSDWMKTKATKTVSNQ